MLGERMDMNDMKLFISAVTNLNWDSARHGVLMRVVLR